MVEEADNRHATNKIEQLIEKSMAHQQTEMFTQFSDILMRVTVNSRECLTQPHSDKIIPFKVQMNLDIPNLEGKIDVESVDNWVQQLESYYAVNRISEAEKITIASLKMSISVHCWWESLSIKKEKEGDPIDTWVKNFKDIWKEFYMPKYLKQQYKCRAHYMPVN